MKKMILYIEDNSIEHCINIRTIGWQIVKGDNALRKKHKGASWFGKVGRP